MSRGRSAAPWRKVVHIAESVGPNGGRYYELKADCGHTIFRPKRDARFEQFLPNLIAVRDRKGRLRKPRTTIPTAPHRVRCIWCELKTQTDRVEPVEPCPECGSRQLCEPDCLVAPWNLKEKNNG